MIHNEVNNYSSFKIEKNTIQNSNEQKEKNDKSEKIKSSS